MVPCESPWKTRKLDVICSDWGGLLTWGWSGVRGEIWLFCQLIVLKLYISDAGNEAILEGVKITSDTEDLIFDFETSDDCREECLSR